MRLADRTITFWISRLRYFELVSTNVTPFPIDKTRMNWPTVIVFGLFHIATIAAFFMFSWTNLAIAFLLHWIFIGFGIGMGYHRLHTHRSYKVPKWLDYFFAVCGTMTLEGGPIFWVATHRIHHQLSDQPGDPHSPRDGAWWAHMGWMLFGEAKHSNHALMCKYAPDLAKDKFYVWLSKYHYVPLVIFSLMLAYIGGWSLLLWGTFVRVTWGLHCTWAVNSATHLWGTRRFKTKDDSRNLWWVALITFGEGWHNNHHAHPTSARHGLKWNEIDMTWMQIWLLSKLGIAKNVKVAKVDEHHADQLAA